jgi:hypothetical protein
MIIKELFTQALITPINNNCNKLYIVSGYASATFTRRHLSEIQKYSESFEVNLIIGMPSSKSDHLAFVSLHSEYNGKFKGYYLQNSPPVHAKMYSWFDNDSPKYGFAGSANYTQYGFFEESQMNQLSVENPQLIKNYFDELLARAQYIPSHEIVIPEGHKSQDSTASIPPGTVKWIIPNKRVTVSFLDRRGDLPGRSGLNWGQRENREPNQAYLSLKDDSRKEGFLPAQAFNFSLITDDGSAFDCVVAQDGRKAIHSTKNNSLLGEYFRKRLGLESGSFINKADLEKYGRTDFTIEKIDDETFLLDFSVSS